MSVTDLSVLMAACGVIVCVPLWFVRLIGKGDSHYNFTFFLSFCLFVSSSSFLPLPLLVPLASNGEAVDAPECSLAWGCDVLVRGRARMGGRCPLGGGSGAFWGRAGDSHLI